MTTAGREKQRQEQMRRDKAIFFGRAEVCYSGNNTWVGISGLPIYGRVSALEYAKRLNSFMGGDVCVNS